MKLIIYVIIFSVLTLFMPGASFSGIIFEDDFADTGVGWVGASGFNYQQDANLVNWDYFKVPSSGSLRTVSGGQNGTPAMQFGYDIGGASLALSLGKFLTNSKGQGYSEIYIRYQVKLDQNWKSGDGTTNYWKWFRLFQNRDPNVNINIQAENDSPKDTRFIICNISNNPPVWGCGATTNSQNGKSVSDPFTKVSFSGSQTCSTCGHFESIQEWDFDNSTGLLPSYPSTQNWHTIEWHIKLSTGTCNSSGTGTENGVLEMWLDGVKQTTSLRYSQKNGENDKCNALPTNKYGGGINWITVFDNMASWSDEWNVTPPSPAGVKYLYLDNVVLSTSYIGTNYAIGGGSPPDTIAPAPPPSVWFKI